MRMISFFVAKRVLNIVKHENLFIWTVNVHINQAGIRGINTTPRARWKSKLPKQTTGSWIQMANHKGTTKHKYRIQENKKKCYKRGRTVY